MRYVEAFPEDLDLAWSRGAPAILSIGALEWHGSHLPLGVDCFLADSFAERLAQETEGVLLPLLVTPITTLPHRHSLEVPAEAFRLILDSTLAGLYRSGARTIALVTGHYAQGHEIELYEAALRAMDDFEDVRVFAATPLEILCRDELLDHAGRWETAQMLAIRGDLVRLNLPESLEPKQNGVLGPHPNLASKVEGQRILHEALRTWIDWLNATDSELRAHYGRRFDAYQPYVDRFYDGSWESAIQKWWATK
ncbi:MAG TPA: creatininase family protein [Fimbriimonas sp.]|nr:creatininase family protein [Fimbriimonas sp.]